jgi:hypothetical protein
MKVNKWTLGLAACGLVSLPTLINAEEKMSAVQTALSATTISGYVNTSVNWNMGTGNANVPGFAYDNGKQDGFNLDVVKVTIERPLDEGQWSAGYKVDTLYGPDAAALNTHSPGTASSDFAIQQAYVDVRAPIGNGLDMKLGVFNTIIGYEVFDAGSNPNYTRSYGYTFEPTTHTGLLLSYQFNEMFGVSGGIANTFGPTINQQAWANDRPESYKTYMASLAFTAPTNWGAIAGSTLYAGIINGLNTGLSAPGAGQRDTHLYLGGAITTPLKGLKVGASYDYVAIDDSPAVGAVPAQSTGYLWALAGYASFQPEDSKWGFHVRAEYAAHDDNPLYNSAGSTVAGQTLVIPTKVFALTGTVQYDLWKNVLSRLEMRWDHSADGSLAYGGTITDGVGGAPTKKNNYMLIANLIYKF